MFAPGRLSIVDDISVPLAIAFNLSIQDGIVPRE